MRSVSDPLLARDAAWALENFGDLIACSCGGDILNGASSNELKCSGCARRYEIVEGVLVDRSSVTEDDESRRLQIMEQQVRDRQARFYDLALAINVPSQIERARIRASIANEKPSAALEIGCGTGRLTHSLAQGGARTVAIDRSFASLARCLQRLRLASLESRVLLVQCDIEDAPVKPRRFDMALMAQVLQHLPGDDLPMRAADKLAESLKKGGGLVLSVYEWRGMTWPWHIKQGEHRGGIYFRRYSKHDVRALLGSRFELKRIRSCATRLLFVYGRRK